MRSANRELCQSRSAENATVKNGGTSEFPLLNRRGRGNFPIAPFIGHNIAAQPPNCKNVTVRLRASPFKLCICIIGVALAGYLAFALISRRPVLAHSPGEWDCACGDMYIKTTRRVIWNPLRDRLPEIVADDFLARLRADKCAIGDEVCRTSLPSHRVSAWRLSYREDRGDDSSLYYKLAKYGQKTPLDGSVGVVGLRKTSAGWRVIGFDSYF